MFGGAAVVGRLISGQAPAYILVGGVTPFIFADLVRLAVLVAFPAISLYRPSLMK